jgi:hypothetical protein
MEGEKEENLYTERKTTEKIHAMYQINLIEFWKHSQFLSQFWLSERSHALVVTAQNLQPVQ